jgi:hypothetical protein
MTFLVPNVRLATRDLQGKRNDLARDFGKERERGRQGVGSWRGRGRRSAGGGATADPAMKRKTPQWGFHLVSRNLVVEPGWCRGDDTGMKRGPSHSYLRGCQISKYVDVFN